MSLSKEDLWRLCSRLSVTQAAILIAGGWPDEIEVEVVDGRIKTSFDLDGLEAAFTALRDAALHDELPVTWAYAARPAENSHMNFKGEPERCTCWRCETELVFSDIVFSRDRKPITVTNSDPGHLETVPESHRPDWVVYYWREPNWEETLVHVEDLKRWLDGKNVYPPFFFPKAPEEAFRNPDHPRYTPKLACAVAAWEACKKPRRNLSVKQTLIKWIEANASRFDRADDPVLLDKDGIPRPGAVEEIAKVANWETKGGVPKTGGEDLRSSTDENVGKLPNSRPITKDDFDGVPF